MSTIYLHIGHEKTGSSYIQSAFSRSGDVLLRHEIDYPPGTKLKMSDAAAGRISSGNGSVLISALGASRLELALRDRTLFSSEGLFRRLYNLEFQARFLEFLDKLGVHKVMVLLFLRDPVSDACSSYQQSVKRGGNTGSLAKHFHSFARPAQVNKVLDFFRTVPNSELTIHNYSASQRDILTKVEEWLGLGKDELARPPVETVNRSLTRAELELQLCINRYMGERCGGVLADHLCNAVPDIRADDIRPPLSEQEALWARLGDHIKRVNSRIPVEARYSRDRDIRPPTHAGDTGELCFTVEQLDIIARRLALQFKELQQLKQ